MNMDDINNTGAYMEDKEYKRILAVGDIHGMYKKLINLMEQVQFNPAEDLLVFLGDYIDRGPQSLECLDYVMGLQQKYPDKVVALMGNHEAMCVGYIQFYLLGRDPYMRQFDLTLVCAWMENSGTCTYNQLRTLDDDGFDKRLSWMGSLPVHFQVDDYFFCHAGLDPWMSLCHQSIRDLLCSRKWFYNYNGDETIVVGHTPAQLTHYLPYGKPVPRFLNNRIILCDTGAYMEGGKLSCVDVLSRNYWQA